MFYVILFAILILVVIRLAVAAHRAHRRSVNRNDGRFARYEYRVTATNAHGVPATYAERLRAERKAPHASEAAPSPAVVIPFPTTDPDLGSIYSGIGAEEKRWEGGGGQSGGAGASASWDEPSRPGADFSNVSSGFSSSESSGSSSSCDSSSSSSDSGSCGGSD